MPKVADKTGTSRIQTNSCIIGSQLEARRQMIEVVSKATRSRMIAGIRGKDTKPELTLRQSLHALGSRYRLHAKGVRGKPDLILPKYKTTIFVHGCFWHYHRGCRYATTPSTRPKFWISKFEANVARDKAVRLTLLKKGWRVATVKECALGTEVSLTTARGVLIAWRRNGGRELEIG
ncbi:very short patch repair endonuclease [Asaia bogorensis]|uniref:very short patch repair endonuclease n=2 Tax=Asaia bogorensis TaxID=91915 RepID=UPI0029F4DA25|nr:DNA mismatch endonuclease Vsr [Asaia bogorensis]